MLSPGKPISAVDTRPVVPRDIKAIQMRRVNTNLLAVEYDRAAGELGMMVRRVALSQCWCRDHPDLATLPSCFFVPVRWPPHFSTLRRYSRSLLTFFVCDLSLSYVYVIHRLGGKKLHVDIRPDSFLGKATSLSTFLASCWDQWKRSENQMFFRYQECLSVIYFAW